MADDSTDPPKGLVNANWLAQGQGAASGFGLNDDGSIDTQDNGRGAFGANTRDPYLKGVATPEWLINQAIGNVQDPKVREQIQKGEYQVQVETPQGLTRTYPIVDIGPASWTGKGLDLTYGARKDLGINSNAQVKYRLVKGSPADSDGQDATPLALMRKKDPTLNGVSDEFLIGYLHKLYPSIPTDRLAIYAKAPRGYLAIQEDLQEPKNPIDKIRRADPKLDKYTDEELTRMAFGKYGKKDKNGTPSESLDEFRQRFAPSPAPVTAHQNQMINVMKNWPILDPVKKGHKVKQSQSNPFGVVTDAANIATEVGKQFIPQSELMGLTTWEGFLNLDQVDPQEFDKTLEMVYPDAKTPEAKQAIMEEYGKMTPSQRIDKLEKDAWSGHDFLSNLANAPRFAFREETFLSALSSLDHRKDTQSAIDGVKKAIGQISEDSAGDLPENQEKAAKTIAQVPAGVLMSAIPGLREMGNYAMLYQWNRDFIKQKNPSMGDTELDQKSRAAADAQFPAQEILSLALVKGGGAITRTITNKVLKAATDIGISGASGAGAFTANKAIQNVAAGVQMNEGLSDMATQGAIFGTTGGLVTAPARIAVDGIRDYMTKSPEGKVAAGVQPEILKATPKEVNDFAAGKPDNAVAQKTDKRATDVARAILAKNRDVLPPAAQEEIDASAQHSINGDQKSAKEAVDRAAALSPREVQEKAVDESKDLIKTVGGDGKSDVPTEEYFYSGFSPKVIIDAFKALNRTRVAKSWRAMTDPGAESPEAFIAESYIAKANAERTANNAEQANELYRQMEFQDQLRGGDDADKREEYIQKLSREKQIEYLLKAEKGEKTGDKIYDDMVEINRALTDAAMDEDIARGVKAYEKRNNYILLSIDKDDQENADNYARSQYHFADPDFVHPREMRDYATALAAVDENGKPLFKFRTFSPEKLTQLRLQQSNDAHAKIATIRKFVELGYAYLDGKEAPWARGWEKRHFPDGNNYKVRPDVHQVIKNAWIPPDDNFFRDIIGGMKNLKAFSAPLRLGYSFAHTDHMTRVNQADNFVNLMQKGKAATAKEWLNAIFNIPTHGYKGLIADKLQKYGGIVNILQGKRSLSEDPEIAKAEAWMHKQLTDSGFTAQVSQERILEWTKAIRDKFPDSSNQIMAGGKAADLGYKMIGGTTIQKFMFEHVIPAAKAGAMMEKIENLYRGRPELLEKKNEVQRMVELRHLNRLVERRFGEMNMDNLFWDKTAKDLGVGMFLSFSWQLGLLDFLGGGILRDLSKNPTHMNDVENGLKQEGSTPDGRQALHDRLLYAGFYVASTMLNGAVMTYLHTGGIHSWMDYFYPAVGTNEDGSWKRKKPLDFPTEVVAILKEWQEKGVDTGTLHIAQNKLSPIISSTAQVLQNTTYFGDQIANNYSDHAWMDKAVYLAENTLLPMSGGEFKPIGKALTGEKVTQEEGINAVETFFGMPDAPKWTGRSALENKIMDEFAVEKPFPKDKRGQEQFEEKQHFKEALHDKDEATVQKSIKRMHELGISDKSIEAIRKHIGTPAAKNEFKALHPEVQAEFLDKMPEADRKVYLPLASKKGLAAYEELKKRKGHVSGQVPAGVEESGE